MRKCIAIGAISVGALLFAAGPADAGPIRNVVGKLKGKPRAVAGKLVQIVASRTVGRCR